MVSFGQTAVTIVQELLAQVDGQAHTTLTRIVREYVFVGHLDESRVLLQHGTKLYVVNVTVLCHDLMYQLALRGFKRHPSIRLADSPPLRDLLTIGLDTQLASGSITRKDGDVVCSEHDHAAVTPLRHALAAVALLTERIRTAISAHPLALPHWTSAADAWQCSCTLGQSRLSVVVDPSFPAEHKTPMAVG
jgi:DNA mismatch repair protein Mlh1 C-terminus